MVEKFAQIDREKVGLVLAERFARRGAVSLVPLTLAVKAPGCVAVEIALVRTARRIGERDALNRLISVSYPDGTYESNRYDKLDLFGRKDRLGNWIPRGGRDIQAACGQLAAEQAA